MVFLSPLVQILAFVAVGATVPALLSTPRNRSEFRSDSGHRVKPLRWVLAQEL
jgi:hypothetical protein